MIREKFLGEMRRIEADLLSMGHMVQRALGDSVLALQSRDFEASRGIIANDRNVNQRCYSIEMSCLQMIATQQPMAGDLRSLASIIAVASELERMHDYAKGIGKVNLLIGSDRLMKPLADLPIMAHKTQDMLQRAMLCFARRDVILARMIPMEDDEIDALYNKIYHEVFACSLEDIRWIAQANYMIWAAHNLERTADRVTNICERVLFMVTGKMVELDGNSTQDWLDYMPSNQFDGRAASEQPA